MKIVYVICLIVFALIIAYTFKSFSSDTLVSKYYDKPNYKLLLKYIIKENLDGIDQLVKSGVDVNRKGKGMTPLIYAIQSNKIESFKFLLKIGADINAIVDNDLSVIIEVIKSNNIEFLKICIENGADVNLLHPLGERPIFFALENMKYSAVDLLLKHSADVNLSDSFNNTVFTCTLNARNFTGCLYLLNKDLSPDKSDKRVVVSIIHYIETAYKVRDMEQPAYKDFFELIEKFKKLGFKFVLKEL
ncbi:MAG: hypothetical protein COA79_26565 [Planctomycetota bacterium]|nr:MAG: hypothetical protein COA79_26565 [Planctomycetota bacterium]